VLNPKDTRYLSNENIKKQRYSFVFIEEKGGFYEYVEGKPNDPNASIAEEQKKLVAAFRKEYLFVLIELIDFLEGMKNYTALSFASSPEEMISYFEKYRLFFEKALVYIKVQLVLGSI